MSWNTNWQQDLTSVDQDSPSETLYNPNGYDMDDLDDYNTFTRDLRECLQRYENDTDEFRKLYPKGFCNLSFDGILCWPPTPLNTTAILEFSNYDFTTTDTLVKRVTTSKPIEREYLDKLLQGDLKKLSIGLQGMSDLCILVNVTRTCSVNGTWMKIDYLDEPSSAVATIYFVGYFISLVTLLIAMGIFTSFKELHCLRNTIHKNLMWSYILTYSTWILILLMIHHANNLSVICNVIITLFQYFHNTTFFWMFVEGLYLYILVVETLTRGNYKLRVYVVIGWGLPMLLIITWAVTKSFVTQGETTDACQWIEDHSVDWIYNSAQLAVLVINLFFFICIMWVLVKKLRTTNTAEIQQYFKAAKALMVLIPLLGATYTITIYAPSPVFEILRAFLLSTQGFAVALLYCFLNHEVQKTIHHRFENWKARRSLGSHRTSKTKDWWPRSRTHSMRHTEWTLVNTDEIQAQINQSNIPNGNGINHENGV